VALEAAWLPAHHLTATPPLRILVLLLLLLFDVLPLLLLDVLLLLLLGGFVIPLFRRGLHAMVASHLG